MLFTVGVSCWSTGGEGWLLLLGGRAIRRCIFRSGVGGGGGGRGEGGGG